MIFGDPGGTRTHNHQNRNLAFYPIELRDQEGLGVRCESVSVRTCLNNVGHNFALQI